MRLTEKGLANLKSDRTRDLMVEGRRGLIVRIQPDRDGITRKALRFRYKRDGISSVVALGDYPTLRVADIEALHARCRQAVKAGGDPRAIVEAFHREQTPVEARSTEGPTVRDVCNEFMTYYAERERARPEQARYLLEHNVLPKLGDFAAASIRKRDIQTLLDGIVARGSPVLANRVQSLLKQAFAVAADRDLIEAVPTFPRKKVGGDERLRTRVLTDAELRTLWHGLDKHAPPRRKDGTFPRGKITRPLALALKLQLVTAQRRGEIAGARWSDVIEESVKGKRGKVTTRHVWRIVANTSDRPHVVPLSPLALELLAELRKITGDTEHWLPSSRTGEIAGERDRSITRAARAIRTVLKMEDWRPHDLRRTARTGMARLGVREEVAERTLNHAPTDRMVAVYNQHAYQDEMQDALERWSTHLRTVVGSNQ